jgi:hypothetical protein
MASGLQILTLGILWVANFVLLSAFMIAGGIVFQLVKSLNTVPMMTTLNFSMVQPVMYAFDFFLLCTLVAISYKIAQALANNVDYTVGM